MSILSCLAEKCEFKELTAISDRNHVLKVTFNEMDCKDLFACEKHASFHLCKANPIRNECVTDPQ